MCGAARVLRVEELDALLAPHLAVRGGLARLGEASGVAPHLIKRWVDPNPKKRVKPSPANLERIAPVLGVPYEELLRLVYVSEHDDSAARQSSGSEADGLRARVISVVRDLVPDEDLSVLERMLSGYRTRRAYKPDEPDRAFSCWYWPEYLARVFGAGRQLAPGY